MEMLDDLGWNSQLCTDGSSGIEWFASRREDCLAILLDIGLPDQTGEACLNTLRSLCGNVPITLISGEVLSRGLRQKLDESTRFILKPVSLVQMSNTIREMAHMD